MSGKGSCFLSDTKILNGEFNPEVDAETAKDRSGENILSVVKNNELGLAPEALPRLAAEGTEELNRVYDMDSLERF
ncbi:hypothetical protein cypCar_00041658 [Cyprinus carpio]|nr:hypothetical protein cypCar_00041658 [Cyprinus carpio]